MRFSRLHAQFQVHYIGNAITRIAEMRPSPVLSTGEAASLQTAEELLDHFSPPTSPHHVLHIDNFFTRVRLFEKLYKKSIKHNGTCKAGSGISRELALFRDCTTEKTNYGPWTNQVQKNVNCIAFVGMRGCTMMTTVQDPTVRKTHTSFPTLSALASISIVQFNAALQSGLQTMAVNCQNRRLYGVLARKYKRFAKSEALSYAWPEQTPIHGALPTHENHTNPTSSSRVNHKSAHQLSHHPTNHQAQSHPPSPLSEAQSYSGGSVDFYAMHPFPTCSSGTNYHILSGPAASARYPYQPGSTSYHCHIWTTRA